MNPSKKLSASAEDVTFMKKAIRLASRGTGFVSPNPLVGAVIVKNGRIIGKGYHERFGGPHAEVNALGDAGREARGATLYVTLEPCNHYGKTPPCTEAILRAKIARVVIGMMDPNPDVDGGGAKFLEKHGLEVLCGVLEDECERQNEIFLKYVKERIPFVISKVAATLDGKTATACGDSKWITGEKSRNFAHGLRQRVSAILVGVETVILDNPMLTVRLKKVTPSHPARFVFDFYGRTPFNANVVRTAKDVPTYLVVGEECGKGRMEKFVEHGVRVWQMPGAGGLIDPAAFLRELGKNGFDSLLVEGGSAVHGSFFDAGLVDKIYFFYAPKILGGRHSRPMIGGEGIARMTDAIRVKEMKTRRIGEDFLVTGYIKQYHG